MQQTARGRYGGRPVKRRRTAFVKGVGVVPRNTIFPAAARGKYRTGGFYGRFKRDGPELKFMDCVQSVVTPSVTGSIYPAVGATSVFTGNVVAIAAGSLVQIAQGDQPYQRTGRRITIKSIHMRIAMILQPTTAPTAGGDVYRFMLILDKQANGAAPAAVDVLTAPSGGAVTYFNYNALENSERFQVLSDVMRPINCGAAMNNAVAPNSITSSQVLHFIKLNKKVSIPIEYSSSAVNGALSTVKSNNLFVLTFTSGGDAQMIMQARLRYVDS